MPDEIQIVKTNPRPATGRGFYNNANEKICKRVQIWCIKK